MRLKQLIRYTNADALEATWVEEIPLPDLEIPAVLDSEGNEIEPARIETGRVEERVVKCQAYDNAQMDMLAADLGEDAPEYQALLNEIAATWTPPIILPLTPEEINREAAARITAIAPEYQQRNMIARSVELLEKKVDKKDFTLEEQLELDAIKAKWARIKEIRDTSNKAIKDKVDPIWPAPELRNLESKES